MKKNLFISLVSFMIISILGILILQGYWIFSAWNDKEEEFSLAVQQSLIRVAEEIQERELTDYINAYEKLIDSIGTPDDASFANVFLFLDELLKIILQIHPYIKDLMFKSSIMC